MTKPLSIVIPIRFDTMSRIENTIAVIKFLFSHFNASIIVFECDKSRTSVFENFSLENIRYYFQEDHDPVFYRTKYLNQMIQLVKTPYVAIWDADVIIPIAQIHKAVEFLERGDADFVYPYEKQFLDTSPILRKMYLECGSIEVLIQNANKMEELYLPEPVGGVFLANTKSYIESGMENEAFYGWGMEDGERYYRWKNKGYILKRIPGALFHLSHERGKNSMYHNFDQRFIKLKQVAMAQRNKSVADI